VFLCVCVCFFRPPNGHRHSSNLEGTQFTIVTMGRINESYYDLSAKKNTLLLHEVA
jgi:hypothetical protein